MTTKPINDAELAEIFDSKKLGEFPVYYVRPEQADAIRERLRLAEAMIKASPGDLWFRYTFAINPKAGANASG